MAEYRPIEVMAARDADEVEIRRAGLMQRVTMTADEALQTANALIARANDILARQSGAPTIGRIKMAIIRPAFCNVERENAETVVLLFSTKSRDGQPARPTVYGLTLEQARGIAAALIAKAQSDASPEGPAE